MKQLSTLEEELHISYPSLYHQLYTSGMLNWGEQQSNWYETVFPTLKQNPPLLLFAVDIEIWDPIVYKQGIAEIKNCEVYDIHKGYKFVPFAQNGAGDLYVFEYDLQDGFDIPITFLPHDESTAVVMAKNLQDFIFRQLLEAVCDIDEYSMFYEENPLDFKVNLQNQLRTHAPYLNEKQVRILQEVYEKDLVEYTYTIPNGSSWEAQGLLTYDEVEALLKREIDFEYLNKEFDYTKPKN
ncbi:SMI1/KNR4 family protein [Myroides sp. LJL116]